MQHKFYQFDYAEMKGFEINSMGILNYHAPTGNVSSEELKAHARMHIEKPDANIIISNIAKLTKIEFEEMSGQKL